MKKNALNVLIGAQLINLNEEGFTVLKDGAEYAFKFVKYRGDCCGYNEIATQLLVDTKEKPVITDVKIFNKRETFGKHCYVTLFGLDRTIAEIDTCSTSRSGWQYGACVKVNCELLGINKTMSSW